ncbi:hypothetical protein PHISP_05173 [Aspergillus sp. HF37]|nr:hypothetical protein PHISP_05173 [Aspergillus sp. HF37]
MPPTFRSSRSGRQFDSANRTRTGQIDHDVFEGLPVRRWTRQRQTITQQRRPEQKSIMQGPDGRHIVPELPMPRDSQLLNPTSRALLRAARAGCIYIRHAPKEPGEEVKDAPTDAEESQTMRLADRSFTARKWTAVPRHVEPPEVEFLASRRSGLPSLYGTGVVGAVRSGDNTSGPAPMRRTRFKKVDPATGNISVYEAWVPDGLRIDGETAEDTQKIAAANGGVIVTPEVPAPGTVVEGVGAVNSEGVVVAEAESASVLSPAKRRPPPPKRKGKGIGRGRRKKVMFAPGEGADASMVHGAEAGAAGGTPETGVGKERAAAVPAEEEEEEGEEGEESDDGDESMVDAKTPETPLQQASEPTPDIKPEPLFEPGPGSSAPTETPAAEAPSQPQPGVSHTLPDMPSEVKQSDEQPAAEDVDMKNQNQATEASPLPTTTATAPESEAQPPPKETAQPESTATEQGPPNEPPESVTENDQAQTAGQSAVITGGAGENNDTDISSREAAPENVAIGDQPGQQIEEKPTTDEAEIEVKKESEDQAGEPTEQAGEQPAEHPSEQKPAQSQELTQDNQQEQGQLPANQPHSQTTENQPEAQPAGEEQVPKQEEVDQTSLPPLQPPEQAPTSGTEDQPNPDEPSAEHEGGLKDVKEEEGEDKSAPTD